MSQVQDIQVPELPQEKNTNVKLKRIISPDFISFISQKGPPREAIDGFLLVSREFSVLASVMQFQLTFKHRRQYFTPKQDFFFF